MKAVSALFLSASLSLCGLAGLTVVRVVHAQDAVPAPSSPAFFDAKIKPAFAASCYKCHTERMAGGLRLDSREALLKGGDSGPAIVVGDPDKSLLVEAVQQTGDLKMPPPSKGAKLTDAEIADVQAWIKAGAVWSTPASSQGGAAALGGVGAGSAVAVTAMAGVPAASAAGPASAPVSATDAIAAAHARLVPASAQDSDFFENKVRPILADNCYSCHSDAPAGDFRADSREGMLKGGDSGPAVVPGDPSKSLLIEAVARTGHLKMPKGQPKLSDAQIEILTEWVKMGAPWPATPVAAAMPVRAGDTLTPEQRRFWSFQPIVVPPEPKVKDAKWAKGPIDRYVLAKLEEQGLTPAAAADRHTLIRRATIDLIGVPPTPEEVAAFEKDKSPDAFAKVVDRLLASPHYGERWGRHWLDVARYADDDVRGLDPKGRGYMPFQGAYVYRDWVIKAVNTDVPYDRFVKMQLAGDFMAKDAARSAKDEAGHDELAATAYIGDGPWIWDQAEPVQGRADERAERVDAVSRGLMGLTVGCARCHNHKYDPISQKDYYSMVGLFASSTFKEYPTVSEPEVAAYREKFHASVALQQERDEFLKEQNKSLANALSYQTSKYMVGAWRVLGKPKMKVNEAADKDSLDPQVLERWVDYLKVPAKYVYLKDYQAMLAAGGAEDQAKLLGAMFQKVVLRTAAEQREIEKTNEEIRIKAGSEKRSQYVDTTPDKFETFDQFCPGCALEVKSLPEAQVQLYDDLFVGSFEEAKPKPGVFSFRGWELTRRMSPQWQEYLKTLNDQIDEAKKALPPYPFVNGVADMPKAVDVQLNLRGNPHSLGEPVPRKFLTVLSRPDQKPFSQGSGRLEFANALTGSPIFARVFVNRVWKWKFGTGIVNTPDDFGIRGDAPSDPALLEYLASDFQQKGYSLKKLQREIMLSAVYQQGDEESPAAHEKDAANRFYSHFSRQRMDAETLRDSVLFVAGDLDTKEPGGPPVELKVETTRPTVYLKVSRFHLSPYLEVFDFPNPGFSADQRFSSNVPLQRLYFMNDPFVYDQAGKLADRVYAQPTDEARIRQAYLLLYGRQPLPKELELGETFLKSTPEKPGYAVAGEPVTAWKEYAKILLSSNEFEFVN